jgi:predicted lactoylglutathione lyase
MPIGENVVKIEGVKIQRVNLKVKDIIKAVTFYLKINTQRIADPSRYAVTFHIVGERP